MSQKNLESQRKTLSSQEYVYERLSMVKEQLEARGIKDKAVLKAMTLVPRHLFVPEEARSLAYADSPLPIGYHQTISQPYIVALMCEIAHLSPTGKILDIGTGSGYQAAVLGLLSAEVYGVEIEPSLADRATKVLHALDYKNVHVKIGDGSLGWKEHAPYDAILVAAASEKVPQALFDQLKVGGHLIMPVGSTLHQRLMQFTKTAVGIEEEIIEPVIFVPLR